MTRGEASMKNTPVVTCWLCGREMGRTECEYDHVVIAGQQFTRIRLGDAKEKWEEMGLADEVGCECETPIGGVHHIHCDQEVCPRCSGQFLGCLMDGDGCGVEEFLCFGQ